jgi:Catechol dioxygenase N terminus
MKTTVDHIRKYKWRRMLMPTNLIKKDVITALAARAAGLDNREGNPRLKQVVNRLLIDLMIAIDDLDISMNEFWTGVAYLSQVGKQNEFGLVVPGVVLEHFLDLRLDEAERRAGLAGGTVRTIEGPLYVAGAPLSKGEARLDDGTHLPSGVHAALDRAPTCDDAYAQSPAASAGRRDDPPPDRRQGAAKGDRGPDRGSDGRRSVVHRGG